MKTKLNNITKSLLVAGIIGGISLPVAAGKYREYSNSTYDYAKVVGVEPLVESYQVNRPVEECWDERVPRKVHYRHDRRHHDRPRYSRTPEILGGLIGAALGNQVGSGRGKKVATVAGAVLGASVGRDIKHSKRDRRRDRHYSNRHAGYEVVKRCELRDSYVTEEKVVGYNVAYKYRGNVFHTEMYDHPGEKIKVKVTVDPV